MNLDDHVSGRTVLITDDEPENIRILVKILEKDYNTLAATDGQNALEIAFSDEKPDLILLDIMMPGMSGLEVCRQLKADRRTCGIPVIFITALDEPVNETTGLKAGAVDYITKPFNLDIVEARVKTQMEIKQHRDHQEELAEQRTRQIIHMERLATLGTLSAGIIHEIANNLNAILGSAELMEIRLQKYYESTRKIDGTDSYIFHHENKFIKDSQNKLHAIRNGTDRINDIIKSMREFSIKEDRWLNVPVNIEKCLNAALKLCHNKLKYKVKIFKEIESELPLIKGNSLRLEQVFINLLNNAADSMEMMKKGRLYISIKRIDSGIRIIVEDTGTGIDQEELETIWEPFFTTKGEDKGTGLGLSICRGIIDEHNGKIWAENAKECGTRFILELPEGTGYNNKLEKL